MSKKDVTQVALTGKEHIDSILTGYKWLPDGNGDNFIVVDTPGSWTDYGYASLEVPFGIGFRPLENPTNAGRALARWSHVADLNFVVGEDGDIRFAQTDADIPNLFDWIVEFNNVAYTKPLSPEENNRGDIWLVNSWADSVHVSNNGKKNVNADPGSYGFFTIMHEIGHALGLDHPHDGIATTSNDYIGKSIMSYRSFPGAQFGYLNDFFPTTPSMYDIAALQYLYGPNLDYNMGPTVYRWEPGAHIFETIWDAGGIDEIDWSNQSTSALIDLHNGAWSELGPAFIFSSTNSEANAVRNNTVAISTAATDNATGDLIKDERGNPINTIENARGGSADDVIIGNQANNRIIGNGGKDILQGKEGTDTYVFHAGDGDDLIREETRGGYDFLEIWGEGLISSLSQVSFSIPTGTDDLLIDLGNSGGNDLGSVTIEDMGVVGSWVEGLHLFGPGGQQIEGLYLVAKYNELAGGTPPGNQPPVLTGPSVLNYGPNQSIPSSVLITSLTDADGQGTIQKVHFEDANDGGGWFEVNGVRFADQSWDAPYDLGRVLN